MTTSAPEHRIASVPLAEIAAPEEQHRERIDPDRLGALADSMAAEGLHQPIGLLEYRGANIFEIIYGHRRYLAAKLLGWDTITARIYPHGTDVLLIRASENLNREQLNPVEEAHVVRIYLDRGCSMTETARRLRRSLAWVSQRLHLLELPQDVLDAIREHGLSLAVARHIAAVDHESYRRSLLYEAIQHGATETTAALWAQHYQADRERIVANSLKVEEIIQERGKYKLTYPCDWCSTAVEYQDTRTVRLCLDCDAQLQAAKTAATA